MEEKLGEIVKRDGFRKKILKVGGSLGFFFSKAECDKYGIELGKIMNLNDAFIEEDENEIDNN